MPFGGRDGFDGGFDDGSGGRGGAVGFGGDFGSGSLDGGGRADVGGGGFSSDSRGSGGEGGAPSAGLFDGGWGYVTDRTVPGYYDGVYRADDLARASRGLTNEAIQGGFGEANRTLGQQFSEFISGVTPQAALAGVAGLALGGPLLGALAYKGVDRALPRGSFSTNPEDPNAPGFFAGLFDGELPDIGLSDMQTRLGGPGARDGFTNPLGSPGEGGALGDIAPAATAAPEPVIEPVPTDTTPEAADPLRMPELLYGPYYNRETGAFDTPGRNPYQQLLARYGVERMGI